MKTNQQDIDNINEFWFRFKRQTFKKILVAFRASQLTQKELADRLGKDPARVSKWLHGDENITLRTMYFLARAIGYRPEMHLVPLASLGLSNHYHDARTLFNDSYPKAAISVKLDMPKTYISSASSSAELRAY